MIIVTLTDVCLHLSYWEQICFCPDRRSRCCLTDNQQKHGWDSVWGYFWCERYWSWWEEVWQRWGTVSIAHMGFSRSDLHDYELKCIKCDQSCNPVLFPLLVLCVFIFTRFFLQCHVFTVRVSHLKWTWSWMWTLRFTLSTSVSKYTQMFNTLKDIKHTTLHYTTTLLSLQDHGAVQNIHNSAQGTRLYTIKLYCTHNYTIKALGLECSIHTHTATLYAVT